MSEYTRKSESFNLCFRLFQSYDDESYFRPHPLPRLPQSPPPFLIQFPPIGIYVVINVKNDNIFYRTHL